MTWEYRGTHGPYWTTTERQGRRRVRAYVGSGPIAQFAALVAEEERDERDARRAEERARRDELADLDAQLAGVSRLVDTITTATLELAGYYCHHRGEWRRHGQSNRA